MWASFLLQMNSTIRNPVSKGGQNHQIGWGKLHVFLYVDVPTLGTEMRSRRSCCAPQRDIRQETSPLIAFHGNCPSSLDF
jgi:hypothetical protein